MSVQKEPFFENDVLPTFVVEKRVRRDEQAYKEAQALWQQVEHIVTDARELRVAYLLFQCNLTPNEIVHHCAFEFPDIREVYSLRRALLKKLLPVITL